MENRPKVQISAVIIATVAGGGFVMTSAKSSPWVGLLCLGVLFAAIALAISYNHYTTVLGCGKCPPGSANRRAYDRLRDGLRMGGKPAIVYAAWLRKFLILIDIFFGDRERPTAEDRIRRREPAPTPDTHLLRVFGLKTPAPLWTAPSFDRCLLLALVYPIVTILLCWVVSGIPDPGARALGLPRVDFWPRWGALAALGVTAFSIWKSVHADGWRRLLWLAFAGAVVVAFDFAGADIGAFTFVVAVAGAFAVAFAGAGVFVFAFAVAFAILCLQIYARKHRKSGLFLGVFSPAMVLVCFAAPLALAHFDTWGAAGPLLLFFGLLTLLNAPFDWISLGVTRALLRRGLERGGLWPYLYGIGDVVIAMAVVAGLVAVLIVGVETFDLLAKLGHGGPILPLVGMDSLLDSIRQSPGDPQHWWVYFLLVSSMLPSLLNMGIGCTALVRGVPGITQWVYARMPSGQNPAEVHRYWMALGLSVQWLLGGLLLALALCGLGLIVHACLPRLASDLMGLAYGLAEYNVPVHIYKWFVALH